MNFHCPRKEYSLWRGLAGLKSFLKEQFISTGWMLVSSHCDIQQSSGWYVGWWNCGGRNHWAVWGTRIWQNSNKVKCALCILLQHRIFLCISLFSYTNWRQRKYTIYMVYKLCSCIYPYLEFLWMMKSWSNCRVYEGMVYCSSKTVKCVFPCDSTTL